MWSGSPTVSRCTILRSRSRPPASMRPSRRLRPGSRYLAPRRAALGQIAMGITLGYLQILMLWCRPSGYPRSATSYGGDQ